MTRDLITTAMTTLIMIITVIEGNPRGEVMEVMSRERGVGTGRGLTEGMVLQAGTIGPIGIEEINTEVYFSLIGFRRTC